MKWLYAVMYARDCGVVSWDYWRDLQVARTGATNKSLCGNSDDKFGTTCKVIFLGVEDRCVFQVDCQSLLVN